MGSKASAATFKRLPVPLLWCQINNNNNNDNDNTESLISLPPRYNYVLEAVVTYTTDLAMQQAAAADALLDSGVYLGALHGIPYGLKVILNIPCWEALPRLSRQDKDIKNGVFCRAWFCPEVALVRGTAKIQHGGLRSVRILRPKLGTLELS